jgi:hypothetical protein
LAKECQDQGDNRKNRSHRKRARLPTIHKSRRAKVGGELLCVRRRV